MRGTLAVGTAVLLAVLSSCSSPQTEDPAAFCDLLRSASVGSSGVATVDLDDSASIEAAIAELDALVTQAPAAAVEDMTIVGDVYREALTALANTAPGARNDVLRELQPQLDTAAEPAADVERYAADVCGVTFEGPAEPTPTPTPVDVED